MPRTTIGLGFFEFGRKHLSALHQTLGELGVGGAELYQFCVAEHGHTDSMQLCSCSSPSEKSRRWEVRGHESLFGSLKPLSTINKCRF